MSFKASDYKHLDKDSLKDFIAEFLVRNETFLKDYSKLHDLRSEEFSPYLYELYLKYRVEITPRDSYAEKPTSKDLGFNLPPAVTALRLVVDDPEGEKVSELDRKKQTFIGRDDLTSADWCKYTTSVFNVFFDNEHDYGDKGQPITELLDMEESGEFVHPDTLILAVKLDATNEKILKEVERILAIHKGGRRNSPRLEQWKYYLIVYDLATQGMTYREIADDLCEAFPDNKNLFEVRNIENYRKNAEKLIKGGYKRYI